MLIGMSETTIFIDWIDLPRFKHVGNDDQVVLYT